MSGYINKDVFNDLDNYMTVFEVNTKEYGNQTVVSVDDLRYLPTEDVAPIKHGSWIKNYPNNELDGNYHCSECGNEIDIATGKETPIDREMYYCPNCGAKMDLESGD